MLLAIALCYVRIKDIYEDKYKKLIKMKLQFHGTSMPAIKFFTFM